MTKIVHLTTVHIPHDVRIFHKECRSLAAAGFELVLIAPSDQWREAEFVDGVRIRGVPRPLNRKDRMMRTMRHVYRAAMQEQADAYHFHDPELIPLGMLLKLRGKRVVYDVHEDVPRQIMGKHWVSPVMRRPVSILAECIEAIGARFWDGIVAVTPRIAARFPDRKTVLVQNYPILAEMQAMGARPYAEREPLVVYVGKIEIIRGAHTMIEAMACIPPAAPARLAIAGLFEPVSLRAELEKMPGWNRVTVEGWLNREGIGRLLGKARIGLVLLHPTGNYLEAQPIKLYEYMAAGIPVIASDFPAWRGIVEGCGIMVDPLQPEEIAGAIRWLLDHPVEAAEMGQRGLARVRDLYSWDREAEPLVEMYRDMLTPDIDPALSVLEG